MELSESEAVIILLQDLAKEGNLDEFVHTVQNSFANFPHIETYVRAKIPPIMLNNYFYPRSGLGFSDIEKWRTANPDWAKQLSNNATDRAKFCLAVTMIENSIKRV